MPRFALFRRLALPVLASALWVAAAGADGPPPPDPPPPPPPPPPIVFDSTRIGFIHRVVIGKPPCDTCAPVVCPGEPVPVTIVGATPVPCIQFRCFEVLPVAAPFTVLRAEFVADTCARACPAVITPFAAGVTLPAAFGPAGEFLLQVVVRSCPDTTVIAQDTLRRYTYRVEPACPPPPIPVDSLVRTFVAFDVLPARRCPGDSLTLRLRKNGCPPCVHLASWERDPVRGFQAVVEWRPQCAELACRPESLAVPLGRFAAGAFELVANVRVRVLDTANPDSVIPFAQRVSFVVPRTCDSTPVACVMPMLWAPGEGSGCRLRLAPGASGDLPLALRSPFAVGGLEGRLEVSAPFRVEGVRAAPGTPGLQAVWTPEGRGARVVVFATGASVPPGESPVLVVRLRADSAAAPGAHAAFVAPVTLVSGADGDALPLCDVSAMRFAPIELCVGARADTCDVNGDGRADVRDLVRLTRCLRPVPPEADSAGYRSCPDCDGQVGYTLNDLICCARHILRAPLLPRDSVVASGDVQVSFGEFARDGAGWRVPVRVVGARSLAGALVRLRYPGDRWRAGLPIMLSSEDPGAYPVHDLDEPGVVQLAWLRLDGPVSEEFTTVITLFPLGSPEGGDRLWVDGVDLVRTDGSPATTAGVLPEASLLTPPSPALPEQVALGPLRPNPMAGLTRFSVSLPAEATIELGVHDVAGRAVAMLARGRFAAGVREFEWDATGARDGVYFVRLVADGRVWSRRVALLRSSR